MHHIYGSRTTVWPSPDVWVLHTIITPSREPCVVCMRGFFDVLCCCCCCQNCLLMFHLDRYEWREIFWSHIDVVGSAMMLRPIVSIVLFSRSPIKFELFLTLAVSQPVKSHVHCFCAFWLYFSVDDCICHCVVCLNWSGGLLVPHFF